MLKRPLSAGLHPRPKRHHHDHPSSTSNHPQAASFDQLWDEIVLVIFSYLSYKDLCRIQTTSQNWSRLALDNQLWKKLYLDEYGRARLRGGRGFIGRRDEREIKSLPSRAIPEFTQDIRDWKWMFRISSNWRTGRCAVDQWQLKDCTLAEPSAMPATLPKPHTCVLLAGHMVITSTTSQDQPSILLVSPNQTTHALSCKTRRSDNSTVVNSLVLDQSPPVNPHKVRLAVFLSSLDFIIFSIDHHHPTQSSRLLSYSPASSAPRLVGIFHAAFYENILVTLSQSFHLSLYDLSSGTISHTQTLSSYTSYPPSSMVLTPITPATYKLVLAYTVPIYPAHWGVGATELIITSEPSTISVSSSRSARAFDVPAGWVDEQKLRVMQEQWGRKMIRVADIQTDGKWVVVAPAEAAPATQQEETGSSVRSAAHTTSSLHSPNSLQLYRISFPTSSSSSPKLMFVRMLHGQVGPCSALSLADGRCVSLGVNGSIWVWDLEGGTGTEVDQGGSPSNDEWPLEPVLATKGTVVFDERRIVSAGRNGVEVRSFDI